jgi:hypothetical protein
MQPCSGNCPKAKGTVFKERFVLPIIFCSFFFFMQRIIYPLASTGHHVQCDYYNLHMEVLVFFKNFYIVRTIEVWSADLHRRKEM